MINKEAVFTVICSALSFVAGIFSTAILFMTIVKGIATVSRLPNPEQCLDMQQRLEKRISDDKRSLELLKKLD